MQSSPRVIIVDDSPSIRSGLRALLHVSRVCNLVGEATNGHEGIALTMQMQPDLVLMDVHMPGMDGLMATESIKHALPQTKVIVMTMDDDHSLRQAAIAAGADAFISKSVDVDALLTSIGSLANGSNRLQR